MKKFFSLGALSCMGLLTGCGVGDKSSSLSVIYGAAAVLSLLLLIGCICVVRKNRGWFVTLFSSVLVVNIGYTLLSVSTCLEMALWANRLSYLGSVFLPLSMLMIILRVTNTAYKKPLPAILLAVATLVFLVAASPGILDVYYKEVSFAVVNGVSTLQKVYGPLHPIYLVYLLGYFSTMITVILRARRKKLVVNATHAAVIAMAVFVNIGVWLIEQLVKIDFEILSLSYIISELFLLGIHLVMQEQQRLTAIVKQMEAAKSYPEAEASPEHLQGADHGQFDPDTVELFMAGLARLTPTETEIYKAYIARATTKEVLTMLNITENTLKYHNRNLYGKLGVSSRKALLEIHKYICSLKEKTTI